MEEKKVWWRQIINAKNIKYVVSSVVSAALEFVVFYLLTSVFFKDTTQIILIGTLIGRTAGTTLCFFLNKYWCFQVYNRTLIQSVEYALLFVVKLYLSYFFVNMIVDMTSINPTLIKMPIDIALFFVGYLVQNYIIFRKQKSEN